MRGQDYGPEVRVGARCLDAEKRRLGVVMRLDPTPHWQCRESESLWRPRSAYVLWDDTMPGRSTYHPAAPYDDVGLSYLEPERLAVVPSDWLVASGVQRAELSRLLCPSVGVLRLEPNGPHKGWWLMNRRDRGWGEYGRRLRHLGELRAQYGCTLTLDDGGRVASRQDEHGLYWPIVEVGVPVTTVSLWLGHRDISTTMRHYAGIAETTSQAHMGLVDAADRVVRVDFGKRRNREEE